MPKRKYSQSSVVIFDKLNVSLPPNNEKARFPKKITLKLMCLIVSRIFLDPLKVEPILAFTPSIRRVLLNTSLAITGVKVAKRMGNWCHSLSFSASWSWSKIHVFHLMILTIEFILEL